MHGACSPHAPHRVLALTVASLLDGCDAQRSLTVAGTTHRHRHHPPPPSRTSRPGRDDRGAERLRERQHVPAAGAPVQEMRNAVVCLINQQRAKFRLPELTESSQLDTSAQGWTDHDRRPERLHPRECVLEPDHGCWLRLVERRGEHRHRIRDAAVGRDGVDGQHRPLQEHPQPCLRGCRHGRQPRSGADCGEHRLDLDPGLRPADVGKSAVERLRAGQRLPVHVVVDRYRVAACSASSSAGKGPASRRYHSASSAA